MKCHPDLIAMKYLIRTTYAAAFATMMLVTLNTSFAQTAVREVTTSTTSAGTISEFGGDQIVIRSETSPEPIRYTYSKSTTYVDETGAPVSLELVKSGLPVTVHYAKEGDRMIASKVIVRKSVKSSAPAIEEKKTKTTTTTIEK